MNEHTEEDRARPRLPPAYRLVALDKVGSTMDEARRLAEAGAEDGTLVWAREQTSGRGRRGRSWEAPPGNLYITLVLRPQCTAAQAAQLSFAAVVALGDAVGSVAPPMVEIAFKWPNDLLVNGRKLAGILLETRGGVGEEPEWVILGLGANIRSFPKDTTFPATSLQFEGCSPQVTDVELLEAFGRHFLSWVNRWLEDGFAPIRAAWLKHARGLGKPIEVRQGEKTLKGLFETLDEDGTLILTTADGTRHRIGAGEVFFGD